MTNDIVKTSLVIGRELLNKVKIEALNQSKTQTELILEYISQGLKRDENQKD